MIAEGLHARAGPAARIGAMLTEEALIVLAAFGACGLLILGVLELLWPTRPRHAVPRRRPDGPRAARPHRQSALTRHSRDRSTPYVRRQAPLAPSSVPLAPLAASVRPVSESAESVADAPLEALAAEPAALAPAAVEAAAVESVTLEPAVSVEPVVLASATAAPPSRDAAPPDALELAAPPRDAAFDIELPAESESVVEICFALYQEQRYAEVIDRGADALTAGPDGWPLTDPQEKAALWSVLALARQALGEDMQARIALENAIAEAPDGDRPTYQRQLASLAESVAQGLMAEAERHASPDSEDCLGMIRSAVAWLERRGAAAPADRGPAGPMP